MKSRDGYNKTHNKAPASSSSHTDAASSIPQLWDAQYHHQELEHKLVSSLTKMMAQLELIAAQIPVPPPVQDQPVQPEGASSEPARMNARVPQAQHRQLQVQFNDPYDRDAEEDYDPDSLLNNIKTSIPEFEGLHDPDLYLDWECKVEKIFDCYDFPEQKKERRRHERYPPVDTWEEMKGLMRGCLIPVHYERELEKKLNRIKQGTRSVEEYHKELETALNRVGKQETLNTTIIRYIEGMNPDIACEVELKNFTSTDKIVHYASILERQLKEGRRRSHHSSASVRPSWHRGTSSTSPSTPSTEPSRPRGQSGLPERRFDRSSPHANQNRARDIQCHKCQGWAYFQNQCPSRRVMFITEQNEIESASEDEDQPTVDTKKELEMPPVDSDEEDPELPHVNLVSIRNLSINREKEQPDQRENIFFTRVTIQDQTCLMIIYNRSVINTMSQELCKRGLELREQKRPPPQPGLPSTSPNRLRPPRRPPLLLLQPPKPFSNDSLMHGNSSGSAAKKD
ncbi:hypothetical protein C2S52_008867 [Perilla frutescens var. hirtella]|nr:hypothetical protein C2S52_008867 [Perilla frutescens var. hirtella]